ncbi:DUF3857 domain-containing protein [Myroides odoratus]|uniref:Domain of Uncharacterized Function with PDB structure n=1 Tax=Myroides odoratus TaxID=256 RepID=A0A378U457_MYROD|nr:DUF3857 domain-containing protein [Myroides odoratus]QQU02850.1 DUF3857 and transglutaminase domain-containing protein [Myroides odoratus]STZ69917.1 Domain of Uncharacterised Function with PDB structure [Myroides odoratus]
MKKIILLLLVLGSPILVFGQDFLGKVTLEELREEKDLVNPEADASILNEEGKVYFDYIPSVGFKMNQVVSRKIKVYTKEGISYVDLSVPYYTGKGVIEQVKIDQVFTYNEKDGKIEKSKLKSNAIFDDKTNENWKKKQVIIPDVKEGSIVEYKYTITSDYFNIIPAWYFQRNIPIRKSSYEVRIPEYLVYTNRLRGDVNIVRSNKTETKKIRVTNTHPFQEVSLQETVQNYTVTNVPPIKSEPYIDNMENYRGSIQFDLSMINYPNQSPKVISLSEDDLIKSIYENGSFKNQLEQTKYFEKAIDLARYKGLTDEEKLNKVLTFVKENISWNEKQGYYTNDGVKKAFENKTGNVAEINLMLTSMLRYVGLTANPILVSTINNGTDLSLQKTSFNGVVSSVELNKIVYLLDGTSKYTSTNIIPIRNLNWIGVIINKNGGYGKVDMKPNFHSISSENFVLNWNNDDVELGLGQALFSYKDYMAYLGRINVQDQSDEQIISEFEQSYENMNIKNIKVYNREDVSKDLNLRFSFEKPKFASKIGNELYLNPMQFYDLKSNPFKLEVRTMPISFTFPKIDLYKVTVKVPMGYEVEYLPKTLELVDATVGLKAVYKVEREDNTLHCSLEFARSLLTIEPSNYNKVKDFYEKLVNKLEDQIIFKKI